MLERFADILWNPWLLGLFLLVGLWCSLRSGFFQLFEFKTWIKCSVGSLFRKKKHKNGFEGKKVGFEAKKRGFGGGLTQFQALATALASTIGTGSIAGVATAIFFGGPGAVFWMWLSALVGLMTSFVEKTLAVKYRHRAAKGGWEGGPMEYLEGRLGWRRAAKWFSLWCVLASLSGGALVQSNSISAALHASFGWDRLAVGVVTALCTGAVVAGGIGRVGKVSEKLVPAMAVLLLGAGGAVIFAHRGELLPTLRLVCTCALNPRAAAGGGLGYTLSQALRYGVARGVFTNEAGLGSSAFAYGEVKGKTSIELGYLGIFQVFVDTIVICTLTALTIICSGVSIDFGVKPGSELITAALATVFGAKFAALFVAFALMLFAFSTVLGWSLYGTRCVQYLFGNKAVRVFQVIFIAVVVVGCVSPLSFVWDVADTFNGLMAIPNFIGLFALSGVVAAETKKYFGNKDNLK